MINRSGDRSILRSEARRIGSDRLDSARSSLVYAAMDSALMEDSTPDGTRTNIDIAMGMEYKENGLALDRSLEEMGGLLAERDEEISALRERLEELEMEIKNAHQEKKELAKVVTNHGGENPKSRAKL